MNPLTQVLDHELAAQGIDDVDSIDFEYAESAIRSLVARLKTGAEWEDHIGARIGHADVLKLTGWSKQALSQAVRGHRVLRLETDDGYTYLLAGFDDQSPARPLAGIKEALQPWASVDPRGWAAASWLMSRQPELGGQTPRDALVAGHQEEVAALADQAAARLAG
jgi:hypothetical protein